jgi:hypothetical protein
MIYDYSLSKVVIFSHKHLLLVDGTTQSVKQRLYSLRNYYRHDPIMYGFLSSCQITLVVNFPCHDRFELNQRIKLFQEIIMLLLIIHLVNTLLVQVLVLQ